MRFTIEHVGLPARDPKALAAWYTHVLDGGIVWQDEGAPVYFVRLPGGLIVEIYASKKSVPDTGDNSVAGFRHLALQVESLEEAQAELTLRGVAFTESVKPAGGGGRVLFFADPEGNLLHFTERPPESVFRR